ncbi:oplophorus-luciferin 2-monooxygenase non-catalytic subunit-like [Parasteatoda tepidariorum]|uniref:oplophorus-luciferin 2-monooxygenase non-catalytic subunit-like n=1 Tax=Parasteatoda tepidariorum TaxID=114398 RepID=UPI00077FCFC1|nr:leucine-rich repeats and immunoglobulin-like domains protein 1 [Parasteatoda tepidariorum]XP_015919048.1 leucine-rich repeats and immunoglobulin-like domains protein 1 [Parasteatoda tepidariorum]
MKKIASIIIYILILVEKGKGDDASNSTLEAYYLEEQCPPSNRILPCTCNGPQTFLLFNCDKIIEIQSIISATRSIPQFIPFGKFSLTNSRIQSLEFLLFGQFEYIYMRKNTLKKIGKEFFDSSRDSLKRIEIIHNDLEKFPFKELSAFSKLEFINLKYNSFKSIPDEAFGKTFNNKIRKIDLSFNKINHIGTNAFKFLTNLESLDLQYNKLTVLNNLAFSAIEGNSKFQLNLNNNKIMYIAEGAFQNQVFKSLNLTDNKLTTLQEKAFREVLKRMAERRTGTISVGKNRFHCTCEKALWVVRLPIFYKLPILEFECSDKDKKSLQELTQHDIGCSSSS